MLPNQSALLIINRADWLGSPASIKGTISFYTYASDRWSCTAKLSLKCDMADRNNNLYFFGDDFDTTLDFNYKWC